MLIFCSMTFTMITRLFLTMFRESSPRYNRSHSFGASETTTKLGIAGASSWSSRVHCSRVKALQCSSRTGCRRTSDINLITVRDNRLLDCGYHTTTMCPPMCLFALLANQADSSVNSYSRLNRHHAVEDNESAVELFCEMNRDPRGHVAGSSLRVVTRGGVFNSHVERRRRLLDSRNRSQDASSQRTSGSTSSPRRVQPWLRVTTAAMPHRSLDEAALPLEFLDNFGFSHFTNRTTEHKSLCCPKVAGECTNVQLGDTFIFSHPPTQDAIQPQLRCIGDTCYITRCGT